MNLAEVILFLTSLTSVVAYLEWDIAALFNETSLTLYEINQDVIRPNYVILQNLPKFKTKSALTYMEDENKFILCVNNQIYKINIEDGTTTEISIKDLTFNAQHITYYLPKKQLLISDEKNKRIIAVNMKTKTFDIIHYSNKKVPRGITIANNYLFWINSDFGNADIVKTSLENKEEAKVIVKNLVEPIDIEANAAEERLYWLEIDFSAEFKVKSCDYNGNDYKLIYQYRSHAPLDLILFNGNTYVSFSKDKLEIQEFNSTSNLRNDHFIQFIDTSPRNILSRKRNVIHQEKIEIPRMKSYIAKEELKQNEHEFTSAHLIKNAPKSVIYTESLQPMNHELDCLNGGYLSVYNTCICNVRFTGNTCEIDDCHNYCLNDGVCITNNNKLACNCTYGYKGNRCEFPKRTDNSELPKPEALQRKESLLTYVLISYSTLSTMIFVSYFTYIKWYPKVKPRIKERRRIIIDRKPFPNSTTVKTIRHGPGTDSCEITIENCCGMTVCDRPCYDPMIAASCSSIINDDYDTIPSAFTNSDKQKLIDN